jgi:hypothetical protein
MCLRAEVARARDISWHSATSPSSGASSPQTNSFDRVRRPISGVGYRVFAIGLNETTGRMHRI